MKPPKLDEKIPPFVLPDQLAALLATCRTRAFHDLRDRAIIGPMAESMVCADELLTMTKDGVSVRQWTARVERGKRTVMSASPRSARRRPAISTDTSGPGPSTGSRPRRGYGFRSSAAASRGSHMTGCTLRSAAGRWPLTLR